MTEISLRNITKRYGDGFPAVSDVSLDIADGEFLVLVGPSGSGKSTVLRMIAGLEDITEGDLVIDGDRVNERAPRDRNLAMVFQNYALYPHLSVFENMAFPLRLARNKKSEADIKKSVTEAAELLELEEHLQRKPGNLSGGQRQRVAMGRAIVRDAKAFLFDEPLSNLDAKLRGQTRTEIARLQRRLGTTTVYVTHDQTEAMTLGDRVAVLRRGLLQQVASPRELYEQPVNLFVAGFIGSPPMNLVPGRVQNGRLHLPFVEVDPPERFRDAIASREGQVLVVGIRPEHFEDAAVIADDRRDRGTVFEVTVDVTEWLGNELYAYVPFEPEASVRKSLEDLDRELDGSGLRSQLVAALDAQSKVCEGDTAQLWFDPARVHVFDVETGENLTRDDEAAAEYGREQERVRHESLEREKARAAS